MWVTRLVITVLKCPRKISQLRSYPLGGRPFTSPWHLPMVRCSEMFEFTTFDCIVRACWWILTSSKCTWLNTTDALSHKVYSKQSHGLNQKLKREFFFHDYGERLLFLYFDTFLQINKFVRTWFEKAPRIWPGWGRWKHE